MAYWTLLSHLSLLTAMTMRLQITWAHAQTLSSLIRANVQSSQTSRPWHKTDSLLDYWKGKHEILSFRSCTYICDSIGSWCAVTGNHLYEQYVVWIWSVRREMAAGPRITNVEEVWYRHRVYKLSSSEQSPICLQVIRKSSSIRPTRNTIVLSQHF